MSDVDYHAPRSTVERLFDILCIALLALLFIYTAKNFIRMPETVPTHINMHGDVDRWGSRWFAWFLPVTATFTFILLLVPDKFPQSMNYPVKITPQNAQRQFLLARAFLKTLKLAVIIMFFVIQWYFVRLALQAAPELNFIIFVAVLLAIVFLPIMMYMYLAVRAQ